MKIYHVETQEDYDALMSELEDKGCKWLSGYKLTSKKYWKSYKENTCIVISAKDVVFMDIEQSKNKYPNIPIIEYKSKGENMAEEEMKQEEMKHKLQEATKLYEVASNVSVSIGTFARGTKLAAEADLQEAKSSAKKLIEKIDEHLESLKPKFKVGDYAVELGKYITKIEKIDDGMPKGCFYMPGNNHFFPIKDSVSSYTARYATPSEIAEYEAALTFHKHGRKPFEVKDGDLLRDDRGNILISDDDIFSADSPKNLKKEYFIRGRYTFLKTVEEVSEWLGADDEN